METTKGSACWIRVAAVIAATGIPVFSTPSLEAVVTSDGHGTHVTAPGEPAFGVNVDGVVQLIVADTSFGGPFPAGTGALVGDRHVLTAASNFRSGLSGIVASLFDQQVRFDLAEGNTTIDVVGITLHPARNASSNAVEDVAVLELAAPAPAAAPRYELFTGTNEIGQAFVKVGYGRPGFGATGNDFVADGLKRAGLNQYDATLNDLRANSGLPEFPKQEFVLAYDFDNGLAANDTLAVLGSPDLGFGDDEVLATLGDEGSPAFILDSGIYRLAGIGLFGRQPARVLPNAADRDVDADAPSSWGDLAFDLRVSSVASFIEDALAGATDPVRRLEFNDGQTHMLATDNNDVIRISNGPNSSSTTLNVVDGASLGDGVFSEHAVISTFGASNLVVSGGSIDGSLRLHDDTHLAMSGGNISGDVIVLKGGTLEIAGGDIDLFQGVVISGANTRVHVTGGTISGEVGAFGASFGFGDVTEGAIIDIDDGLIHSEQTAVNIIGDTTLNVRGGTINGGLGDGIFDVGVSAQSDSTVNISGGLIHATTGIELSVDTSVLHMTGGMISGTKDGLLALSSATVHIDGGEITGGQSGVFEFSENGILAAGQAEVGISNGVIEATFGVSAFEDATIEMTGGTISGILDGLYVDHSATARVEGGQISTSGADRFGIRAFGNAYVSIADGEIRGSSGISSKEASLVDIFGGTIEGQDVDLLVSGPDAMIRVFGHNFSQRPGALSALAGSFSGQFADGSPFHFTFNRSDGGTIMLVPEPGTWLLLSLALVAFLSRANSKTLSTGRSLYRS